MAHHQRTPSTTPGGTHAISLKVLRLSRPSLATQTPLPPTTFQNGLDISPAASRAFPSSDESGFPLTPLLTLPAAFGAAYVGETFTCTLCANNEVREGEGRSVGGVRIGAELQTPGAQQQQQLELEQDGDGDGEVAPGETLQRTLRHELKEEGQHVLAVTVTYTETSLMMGGEGVASGGRARTFRKLYQFVAQQLIVARSKVTERMKRRGDGLREWVLEAQLENVGETSVVLEKLWLREREGIGSVDLNQREGEGEDEGEREATVLKPQDVEQVMFLLREEEKGDKDGGGGGDARIPLAQLNIDWRSALGEQGSLTTGWLASRSR